MPRAERYDSLFVGDETSENNHVATIGDLQDVDGGGSTSGTGGTLTATADGTQDFRFSLETVTTPNVVYVQAKSDAASTDHYAGYEDGELVISYATPPMDGEHLEWDWFANTEVTAVEPASHDHSGESLNPATLTVDGDEVALQTDVEGLESGISSNSSDIDSLQSSKADQADVDSLESEVSNNTSDIDSLQSQSGGIYEVVATASDTDETSGLDLDISIPDPEAYATYEIRGMLTGQAGSGDGANVGMDITLNNNTDAIYDYSQKEEGTTNYESGETAWTEQLWRRYKTPINYTINADSVPSTDESEGTDTAFVTINSNGHQARRGLESGRIGGGYANGGHPFATIESIQLSASNAFTADVVVYGLDWRSDL